VLKDVSRNAAHAAMEVLRKSGVTAVFGNPGTTELPLMQALSDQAGIAYYLALQEGVSAGMAAGYAAASGRLGVAMLHAVPGIANGLANYYNAFRNGLPVLMISGQQDRRHQYLSPILYGDLDEMAKPFAKWTWEPRTAEEMPDAMRRAVAESLSAPTGPSFLSLPLDLQLAEIEHANTDAPAIPVPGAAGTAAVSRAVDLLLRAERPAIVAGDLIGRTRSDAELAELAQAGGIAAYWEPMSMYCNFPTVHPAFQGVLFPSGEDFRRVFNDHDVVLWCGADLRTPLLYDGSSWHDANTRVIVLGDSTGAINEGFAPVLHLVGDPKETIVALTRELRQRAEAAHKARIEARAAELANAAAARREKVRGVAARRAEQTPPAPVSVIQRIMDILPEDAIVVDDAVSNSGWVSMCGAYRDSTSYFGPSKGGGIGLGLPLALGVKVAHPDRPVLALIGDGASMYSIQGLWTAARHDLPVVFVILNNASYRILKGGVMTMFGDTLDDEAIARVPGFDLDTPAIDFVACANSFGVGTTRVDALSQVQDAVRAALDSGKPWLVDIAVEREARKVLK
jgi:benzoylformate decarboxylase